MFGNRNQKAKEQNVYDERKLDELRKEQRRIMNSKMTEHDKMKALYSEWLSRSINHEVDPFVAERTLGLTSEADQAALLQASQSHKAWTPATHNTRRDKRRVEHRHALLQKSLSHLRESALLSPNKTNASKRPPRPGERAAQRKKQGPKPIKSKNARGKRDRKKENRKKRTKRKRNKK